MNRELVMSSSPEVSKIVCPVSVLVKSILPFGHTFKSACRNEPGPLSALVVVVMFVAQTLTVKEQVGTCIPLLAVQVTRVVPTGNRLPDGGVQATITGGGEPVVIGGG